ncbi:hypothetical protein F4780DRAFT_733121 [Xylariomycetidae sp. FL0641]|nr:hypothetical protein F4780DRAFT_733121 [Xylariomycetidae sp. FL0641]
MVNFLLTTAALTGLASATPLVSRQTPNYPPTSQSQGFQLIANVTDPSTDLSPSVNGFVLSGIHVGAGLSEAVVSADSGLVFYHNGTAQAIKSGSGSILMDGGTPPFPWGISIAAPSTPSNLSGPEHYVGVNAGSGTSGVTFASFPDPYAYLTAPGQQGTFAACARPVEYYGGQVWTVVRWVEDVWDEEAKLYLPLVPQGCTRVNFLPQCAPLPGLPADAIASHEFALSQRCYEDVSAIQWGMYGP